jgi:hypothetical protein
MGSRSAWLFFHHFRFLEEQLENKTGVKILSQDKTGNKQVSELQKLIEGFCEWRNTT